MHLPLALKCGVISKWSIKTTGQYRWEKRSLNVSNIAEVRSAFKTLLNTFEGTFSKNSLMAFSPQLFSQKAPS